MKAEVSAAGSLFSDFAPFLFAGVFLTCVFAAFVGRCILLVRGVLRTPRCALRVMVSRSRVAMHSRLASPFERERWYFVLALALEPMSSL